MGPCPLIWSWNVSWIKNTPVGGAGLFFGRIVEVPGISEWMVLSASGFSWFWGWSRQLIPKSEEGVLI